MKRLFTSESVTEGHPDKLCDQVSDAILDAIFEKDPNGRVAAETTCTTGYAMVMGEITTNCYVDIPKIVRKTILDIGYDRSDYGFDGNTCAVLSAIDEQSSDIALGVDVEGAGDQGMMFGYACNETPELMPAPIQYAHTLAKQLTKVRKDGTLKFLRPDGKTQITVEYDGEGKVARLDTILISTQHDPDVTQGEIASALKEFVIPVLPQELIDKDTKILVNPTGRFVIGGPHGDSGLTGRKIIVDTYGGAAKHGGGAFSGKDPTKVDRSAAYAARHVAKSLVAAGIADKLELQVAYAIGVAEPVSLAVDTYGTGKLSDDEIIKIIQDEFDLRPAAIIKSLDLRRPIYKATAAYGHFGRPEFPWEQVKDLKKYL